MKATLKYLWSCVLSSLTIVAAGFLAKVIWNLFLLGWRAL